MPKPGGRHNKQHKHRPTEAEIIARTEARLTKSDLLAFLREMVDLSKTDPSIPHEEADGALLQYIDDREITTAFKRIKRLYT